ncbi:hypothetical protein A2Y99_05015 [Candidatus Gottesmanbacteria bacterium RBG_13_37_7]|uniref:Uncharacterized protein n=1 Tax=Candidatus Gottesmanbacteria bacterium RBG_13_37_7 TaxID=1798369 RepID=A0A1F5YGW4_9BACT|nr:MAG: hypothetical protein A2Y99_05015 [Candidatus Gottesmanbacteria bacterium RBG_13_37_7]
MGVINCEQTTVLSGTFPDEEIISLLENELIGWTGGPVEVRFVRESGQLGADFLLACSHNHETDPEEQTVAPSGLCLRRLLIANPRLRPLITKAMFPSCVCPD